MTSTIPSQPPLRFSGHKGLVWRLLLATLTGRAVRISQIRAKSHINPGLLPHEVSFIRLLDAITNGSTFEFSYTGTTLLYHPGLITGSVAGHGASGGIITHELPAGCTHGISYFLIPLCLLAPFSKSPISIRFTGPGVITSATPTGDVSADTVRTALLPLYNQFGIMVKQELRIDRRSCAGPGGRGGGGEVHIVLGHQVRLPRTLHLMNPGKVKSVRGVAYSTGVAGTNNYRMIDTARSILNSLVPDTYIFSDTSSAPFLPSKDKAAPKRKIGIGFGLSLVAESSSGCLYSADVVSAPDGGEAAEDIGRQCALQLLDTISKGGCATSIAAPTLLTMMAMGSEDVGRLQVSKDILATGEIVSLARDLTMFGCAGWGFRDSSAGANEVVISIVGKGVGNVARKAA
ncbi:hypothetical protein FH972_026025 [Carpinus fangiana]|uniref:RNA 3'-terminal phosphate cyclase domain-containing protein n=1 Tax=Carpinus fangiana TaxID=176857 RepID=A0A5N6L341_9ROSI|nr:hypothetical protein FH972_026025 [Carpinus fangiana]